MINGRGEFKERIKVLTKFPHPQSRASYISLVHSLWEVSDHPWWKWNEFKRKYLLSVEKFKCPQCKKVFELEGKRLSDLKQNRKKGKVGPFCSKSCAGKGSHRGKRKRTIRTERR